ncbi:MAG: hypothetical protein AAF645_26990, partial [Myxococcota bacterium]
QTNAAVALSYRGTPESAEALATLFRSNTELAAEVSRRARAITFPFDEGRFAQDFVSRARYLVMLQGLGVGDPWSVYTTALKER